MNTGTERTAIESIYGSLKPIRLEQGQRFVDEGGVELRVAGISRANFFGGDCAEPIVVLSASGLKKGVQRPSFRVINCAGTVVVRPQTQDERIAEGIASGFASRFVAEVVEPTTFDNEGRCVVRKTGVTVSYPLLISAGVND